MLKLQVHIALIKRAFERACFASIRLCTSVGLGLVLTACGDGALLTSDVNAPRARPTEQPLAGAGSVFNGNGWYWDSTAAGTGLMIEAQDATAFVAMFVYDDAGEPVWYASSGAFTVEGSLFRFSGSLLEYTGGQSAFSSAWRAPTSRAVGNLDIIFTGTGTDTRAIVNLPGGRVWVTSRFNFNGLGLANAGAQPEIGWFWNASQSGRGYAFEVQNNQYFMAMFHYRTDGRPTWNVVQGNMSGSNFASSSFLKYSGGQTINGAYKAPSTPTAEGVISASFSNPCSGSLVLPSGAAVSLQKFSFGGLPAGAECRSMPQVSTVVATTTSNTSTTTGSIGGSSTATTSEVAVTSISGGPFIVGTPALLTLSGTNLNLGRVLRFEVSSGAFSCAETNASQTQCTVIGAGTSDLRVIEKSTGRLLKQFSSIRSYTSGYASVLEVQQDSSVAAGGKAGARVRLSRAVDQVVFTVNPGGTEYQGRAMDSSRIWWDVGLTPPQGVSSFTFRPSARDLWVDVQGSNALQNYSDASTLYTVTVTGSGSGSGTITVNLPGL